MAFSKWFGMIKCYLGCTS